MVAAKEQAIALAHYLSVNRCALATRNPFHWITKVCMTRNSCGRMFLDEILSHPNRSNLCIASGIGQVPGLPRLTQALVLR